MNSKKKPFPDAQDEIIRHMAKKYGMTVSLMKLIISSQSKTVAHYMGRSSFETIEMPKFGTFNPKRKKMHILFNKPHKGTPQVDQNLLKDAIRVREGTDQDKPDGLLD